MRVRSGEATWKRMLAFSSPSSGVFPQLVSAVMAEHEQEIVQIMRDATDESGLQRRTGELVGSEYVAALHRDSWPVTFDFGATAPYARYLNEGTQYIGAYHFIELGVSRAMPLIRDWIRRAIADYIRTGSVPSGVNVSGMGSVG